MMRSAIALAGALSVAGCGLPATIEPSQRNAVAVVNSTHRDNLGRNIGLRLVAGQVLVPARAAGQEEFCTFARAIYASATPPGRSCFFDASATGRFTMAYQGFQTRGFSYGVNIPYVVGSFPCENCAPPSPLDVRDVSDPDSLASLSIAPTNLRSLVALTLRRDPELPAAIAAAHGSDAQRVSRVVDISAREVQHRRAFTQCSDFFSPVAAVLVPFGAFAAAAASQDEEDCIDRWLRTGQPPAPR